jgi:hypothetical protein
MRVGTFWLTILVVTVQQVAADAVDPTFSRVWSHYLTALGGTRRHFMGALGVLDSLEQQLSPTKLFFWLKRA